MPQAHYDHPEIQFADHDNVQVAEYGDVKSFQPSESESDNAPEVNGGGEFWLPCTLRGGVWANMGVVADGAV